MAWDSVPWFIGGGAQHSPEVARLLAYAATGGAEGVVGTADLKVTALPVPGASVRVAPGAGLIRNRATGGDSQTYVARLPVEDTVGVASTGSGAGRSDLVVAQIEDPFMAGEPWQTPADPKVGPYIHTRIIPNVPAGTTRLQDVPGYAGRSAITLARIDFPASTGTVTAAMIKDLRAVSNPRTRQVTLQAASTGNPTLNAVNPANSSTFAKWPAAATWTVDVPEWATHAQVRGDVVSYVVKSGSTTGQVRAAMFDTGGVSSSFDENYTGDPFRGTLAFASEFVVPAEMRGTRQTLTFEAIRSLASGFIDADKFTTSIATISFSERAA